MGYARTYTTIYAVLAYYSNKTLTLFLATLIAAMHLHNPTMSTMTQSVNKMQSLQVLHDVHHEGGERCKLLPRLLKQENILTWMASFGKTMATLYKRRLVTRAFTTSVPIAAR